MVATIFSYKIVHVGDFILSLLRLYLCFFRTFFYEFFHTWGTSIFSEYFVLFHPTLLYEFT